MSAYLSRKATTRYHTTDPHIEALQDHLLKSLTTAFDRTAITRSNDIFIAQNFNSTTSSDFTADPFARAPYQTLTDKARTYIEKAEAERPLRPKVSNTKKKNNTFVTYVEIEGNMASRRAETMMDEPIERYQPQEPITYDNILLSVSSNKEKKDDLEELRRMIKKTKRDINAFGRELISLKEDVVGVNDYASRELGYGANNDLMYNVENEVNTLKRTGEFKPLSNRLNTKLGENNKRFSKIGTSILNSSGSRIKTGGRTTLRKW